MVGSQTRMPGSGFRCEVLFGLEREPAWPRISDILATLHAAEGRAVHVEPQRGGHAVLSFPRAIVEATYLRLPSPAAASPPAQAAHVVLHARGAAGADVEARLADARALAMVAGALALRRDCLGVIWDQVPRLLEAEAVARAATRLARGELPIALWVAIGGAEAEGAAEAVAGAPLRSQGLAAFFGRELELDCGPAEPRQARRVFSGLVEQVFSARAMIADGATLRIEGMGTMQARHFRAGAAKPPLCRIAPEGAPPAAAPAEPHPEAPVPLAADAPLFASCTAVLLFVPSEAPDAADLTRAVLRQTRRTGAEPQFDADAPDRLILDWGTIRGLGRRRTEIVYDGWGLPEALRRLVLSANPDLAAHDPGLLQRSHPVLVRDLPAEEDAGPSVAAAMLIAHVAAAILGLAASRGIVWPASGVLLGREAAVALFRRAGARLPVPLCVGTRGVRLPDGRRVLLTRGLAELGELEVMMACDDSDDRQLRPAFDMLVRGLLQRSLARRGEVFVNALDGAEFALSEERAATVGTVMSARLTRPPKSLAGLMRLIRRQE